MQWYAGNIAEAVEKSKKENALFLVAIFGDDTMSKNLEAAVESPEVQTAVSSSPYVCIRLTAGSPDHLQFKALYANADSPSLYFISKMGAPVEVVRGDTPITAKELRIRFDTGMAKHMHVLQTSNTAAKNPPKAKAPQTSSGAQTPSGVKPQPEASGSSNEQARGRETTPAGLPSEVSQTGDEANLTLEQKIERARLVAAARAQQKLEEEAEDARKQERERREAGKGMAELKRWQDEEEAKRMVEERKRDKLEEQQLRQRLREQIAQDRAERNKRSNASIAYDGAEPSPATQSSKPSVFTQSPANYAGKARLQFRMPDGSSQNHNFDQDVTLGHVRNFLIDGNHVVFKNFNLCAAFPRREFTSTEYAQTLKDLGLLPSAALLIIPSGGKGLAAMSGSGGSGLWVWVTTILGYILYPVTYLFGMMQRTLPSSAPPTGASGPTSKENVLGGSGLGPSHRRNNPARRDLGGPTQGSSDDVRKRNVDKSADGNIHRLRNQESDSEDDLGTWNGNSTQQKPR